MAYRVHAQFADSFYNGWLSDIIAAPAPERGDAALELSLPEWTTLRNLVARNYTPNRQIDARDPAGWKITSWAWTGPKATPIP